MEIPKTLSLDFNIIKIQYNAKLEFHLRTDEKETSFTMYTKQFNIIIQWAYAISRIKYPWFTMSHRIKDDLLTEIIFKENKINPQYKKVTMEKVRNPYFLTPREELIQNSYKEFINNTWQDRTKSSNNKITVKSVRITLNTSSSRISKLEIPKITSSKKIKILRFKQSLKSN